MPIEKYILMALVIVKKKKKVHVTIEKALVK